MSKRIRVMMIGPLPKTPNQINGGVAAAQMYLSNALVDSGMVELTGVRIARDGSDKSDKARFEWPIEDLPLGRLSMTTFYARQRAMLDDLIRKHAPDVVHAQGADVAGFMAVRCGTRAVVTVHGLLADCARYQTGRMTRWRAQLAAALTERGTVRRARDLIVISPYVASYYGTEIHGRVHNIPNAVSSAYFQLSRLPQPGRFLFAGRIAHGKGLAQLIRAFARIREPHWTLVLAGATPDPAYERSLRNEASGSGVSASVTFAGLLDEAALQREFACAEALVLPSFQETAPMVVQQAMAAGLPVIATRVGGIPFQIAHEQTGILVTPGDERELADALGRIARDPSLAIRIGAAARRVAYARYHGTAVASATVSVYRELLSYATKVLQ